MRTAFNDFFYEKRGIYGVLHVMILLLSLFLIVDISIDTFNNIPFISQTSYLKTQFWICMFFIADFILEFFLSKDKIHYLQTHFLFLLVSIPYLNIINYYDFTFSAEVTYFLRFIHRSCLIAELAKILQQNRLANFEPGLRTLRLLPDDVAGNGLFLQPDLFRDRTEGEP